MTAQVRVLAVALLAFGPGIGTTSAAEKTSLSPPVYLPDGKEFKTWETPVPFTRVYHVAQAHPRASDDNPGTEQLPLKTIGGAARLLQPGERVVVGAGVYRERVRPARGGTGPDRMISYEAATGATVVISGSEILKTAWGPSQDKDKPGGAKLWMTRLPKDLFPLENPFAQVNLADQQIDKCMDWAVGTKGKSPNTLRRGLVFQNGQRLKQVARQEELAAASGAYWVEQDGLTLHLHPLAEADPNQVKIEITTRSMIFAPETFGLGYIRVKGFALEHSGNCFPRPQHGALSTMRGHHWIIEDNTVRECNAIGIDIGDQFDTSGPQLAEGGQHIVRRNTVSECGIGGIEGKCIEHTLIEENHIFRCGWQRAQYIWETGGIKVHCTLGCLLRRNVIHDTIDAPGIWMDYENRNSRCTQNVVFRTGAVQGGIFMEASQVPNLVDRNIVWASAHSGIYQHDCDELLILHNLVGQCADAGIRMQICKGRKVGGRLTTAKRNKVMGNILVDNGQPMAISDPENTIDCNFLAVSAGHKPFDLAAWQAKHNWDAHSTVARVAAAFKPSTLELTLSVSGDVPRCLRHPAVDLDFFGRAYFGDSAVSPGPFAVVPSAPETFFLGFGGKEGFVSLFNGLNLDGWTVRQLDNHDWSVVDGVIDCDPHGPAKGDQNLWTTMDYGDFELLVDWRIKEAPYVNRNARIILPDGSYKKDATGRDIAVTVPNTDSGIFLRGQHKSQANIWCWPVGSGEVWGYRTDPRFSAEVHAGATPKLRADRPIGQWNTFHIVMKGDRLTVKLNDQLVIDNAQLPHVPAKGPIALQHHADRKDGDWGASLVQFRNIYIRELK